MLSYTNTDFLKNNCDLKIVGHLCGSKYFTNAFSYHSATICSHWRQLSKETSIPCAQTCKSKKIWLWIQFLKLRIIISSSLSLFPHNHQSSVPVFPAHPLLSSPPAIMQLTPSSLCTYPRAEALNWSPCPLSPTTCDPSCTPPPNSSGCHFPPQNLQWPGPAHCA